MSYAEKISKDLVVLKDQKQEKTFIDELRIRNGNLEISMLPYVEPNKSL